MTSVILHSILLFYITAFTLNNLSAKFVLLHNSNYINVSTCIFKNAELQ